MTLPDYIAARLSAPFKWGEHDCVCFAVGWLEISTGRDYLGMHRPWSCREEAEAIIDQLGGLEATLDRNLRRIAPGAARDGDLALIDGTVYLFSGANIVGPGRAGLVFKNRLEAKCAWSY